MALLASIALDNTAYSFDKVYDYLIPDSLRASVFEGCRVFVPFGRSNAKRQGVILKLFEGDSAFKKEIDCVLDSKSYLSDEMLRLIPFLKERYFCTYFDALKTVLPKGINYRTDAVYFAVGEKAQLAQTLQDGDEKRIYQYLLAQNTPVDEKTILKDFGLSDNSHLLSLIKRGLILKDNRADRNMADPTQKMVKMLLSEEEYVLRKSELTKKQRMVGDLLADVGAASLKEITYFCAVSKSVIDSLVKKDFVQYFDLEIDETEPADDSGACSEIVLSAAQQKAFDEIHGAYMQQQKPLCALLFGVTGSGKTPVYLKLIDDCLSRGKSVIVMVPEISLTPQTLAIFKRRYAQIVAVFHSRLSVGQRMAQWKRVKSGAAQIVVGTRSAIFAPCENIGLIIIDEEQEHTYKSEMSPRYDALEVARFRCAYHNALLVLASATPAVTDFEKARRGTYLLAEIPERYGQATLPEVITVDMRTEIDETGQQRIISRLLMHQLREQMRNREQSILLLNRRGFQTFVVCSDCGEVLTCPHCNISLTYHKANHRLMCHFCGYSARLSELRCAHCDSNNFTLSGYGTQRIEAELESAVPQARILRMDTDSTLTKLSHEQMLEAFSKGEYDILIGTQMVAKGLNFPNVTLAAVVNADQSLYNYDYRCSENTFDLITQVVGRSGRGKKQGKAIIQTATPDNPILKLAAKQDYNAFFKTEISLRELLIYPPFCDLCLLACVSSVEAQCAAAAAFCFQTIKALNRSEFQDVKIMILGPAPAKVNKAFNKFRYRLIIKCKNSPRFRAMIHQVLIRAGTNKELKNTTVFADINPVDIM